MIMIIHPISLRFREGNNSSMSYQKKDAGRNIYKGGRSKKMMAIR